METLNPWTTLVVRLSGVIGIVICFLVIAWCIKRSIHKRNDRWEKYLNEEREANANVQASFPFQLLLTIEWDKIPLSVSEEGKSCYQSLLTFQTRKINQNFEPIIKQLGILSSLKC